MIEPNRNAIEIALSVTIALLVLVISPGLAVTGALAVVVLALGAVKLRRDRAARARRRR
jgi:NhaP-type Na+/H+ or K+/H+ antiporter